MQSIYLCWFRLSMDIICNLRLSTSSWIPALWHNSSVYISTILSWKFASIVKPRYTASWFNVNSDIPRWFIGPRILRFKENSVNWTPIWCDPAVFTMMLYGPQWWRNNGSFTALYLFHTYQMHMPYFSQQWPLLVHDGEESPFHLITSNTYMYYICKKIIYKIKT